MVNRPRCVGNKLANAGRKFTQHVKAVQRDCQRQRGLSTRVCVLNDGLTTRPGPLQSLVRRDAGRCRLTVGVLQRFCRVYCLALHLVERTPSLCVLTERKHRTPPLISV